MPYIQTYAQDAEVTINDKLLGSDGTTGDTKNYSMESVVKAVTENYEGFGIVIKYADSANVDSDATTTGYFTSDSADITTITQLNINKTSQAGVAISGYIDNLITNISNLDIKIKLEKTSDIGIFGYFRVDGITDNTTYYTIDVEKIGDVVSGTIVDLESYYLRFEIEGDGDSYTSSTLLLDRRDGREYVNADGTPLTHSSYDIDLSVVKRKGFILLKHQGTQPTFNLINQPSPAITKVQYNSITVSGIYEIHLWYWAGTVYVNIPNASGGASTTTPNPVTGLTLTEGSFVNVNPVTNLSLTEGTF